MSEAKVKATANQNTAATKSKLRQNLESLAVALLVALAIRATIVEAFWVPSGSMLPTIQIGDHLFVNKLAYGLHFDVPFTGIVVPVVHWGSPRRGDIVVFVSPADGKTDLIKRVVAVAGDRVEVRHKRLYINGEPAPDAHAHFKFPQDVNGVPRDNFGPVVVPPGKFFVMGDNRDESLDSRYWGFADEKAIKGRATFVYWSGWNFHRIGTWLR